MPDHSDLLMLWIVLHGGIVAQVEQHPEKTPIPLGSRITALSKF
jgi:hypothetical protein